MMRCHLTPARMAKINHIRNNTCWWGCGKRGTLLHSWWECELVQPLWKTVWRFLKELKIELPYDPAIALLEICPKDTDAVKRQDTCTPMFIAAMSTIAKLWKEPRCPSEDEWIKKMWSWAAWVAQRFSATFSPGPDPGDPGESHVRLPAWSLLLPLPLSLSLCLSLMNK